MSAPTVKARNDEPGREPRVGQLAGAMPSSARVHLERRLRVAAELPATCSARARSTPRRTVIWASSFARPRRCGSARGARSRTPCSASSDCEATEVYSPRLSRTHRRPVPRDPRSTTAAALPIAADPLRPRRHEGGAHQAVHGPPDGRPQPAAGHAAVVVVRDAAAHGPTLPPIRVARRPGGTWRRGSTASSSDPDSSTATSSACSASDASRPSRSRPASPGAAVGSQGRSRGPGASGRSRRGRPAPKRDEDRGEHVEADAEETVGVVDAQRLDEPATGGVETARRARTPARTPS